MCLSVFLVKVRSCLYLTSSPVVCFFSEEISIGEVVPVGRDVSYVEAGGMELDVHRFRR